jgi:3-isopropylmalate dehydratase small subunit
MTANPNRHRQRRYTGRAWVFGDSINTDAMYPGFALKMDIPEAAQHVFYDLRPAGSLKSSRATSSSPGGTSISAPADRSRL